MTAALNAWKRTGMVQIEIPAFNTPEERAIAISQFESKAARKVIAAAIGALENIPGGLTDYLISQNDKCVYFHNEESKVANWTKMPEGYKPVVYNNEQWNALRFRFFAVAYAGKFKSDFEHYIEDKSTKSTHEKILQGVLLIFKNASAFKLDQAEEILKFFDEAFKNVKGSPIDRKNLLLAISYGAINRTIQDARDAGLKIESEQPTWEWNQTKIKAIAPGSK